MPLRWSITRVIEPSKTAGPINIIHHAIWEGQTRVSPRKREFNGGTHWCHMANTIEQSVLGVMRAVSKLFGYATRVVLYTYRIAGYRTAKR